jgi:two-component system KDP operon response regulator KdpE
MTVRELCVLVISKREIADQHAFDKTGKIAFRIMPATLDALVDAEYSQPDVIVIDARDSFLDFVQLLNSARTLRRLDLVPVLAWVGSASSQIVADAFDAGAADCLAPDLADPESVARVRAAHSRNIDQSHRSKLRFADLTLDPANFKAWYKGRTVPLTVFQIRFLEFLMNHPTKVFTNRELLDQFWGKDWLDEATVATCVSRIRRVLGNGRSDGVLRSVRGVGYSLDVNGA